MLIDRSSSRLINNVKADSENHPTLPAEKFVTIKQAAEILGLKYWQVQRAVSAGLIPGYRPFGPRRCYVRLSEVIAYIESHRLGGCAVDGSVP